MDCMRPSCPLTLVLLAAFAASAAYGGEITVYRCTDANGRVSLRDTPCPAGQRQSAREMVRPKDPPPRPALAMPAASPPAAPAPVAPPAVVVYAPEPTYECVTPDGERYTASSPEGNPRWVPLWTLGYPVYPDHHGRPDGVHGRIDVGGGHLRGRVDIGGHLPPRPPLTRPVPTPTPSGPVAAFPAGTWVRDACTRLPQAEVCARLRDRREALDRRYNSALQSERHRISDEQRLIDARLDEDCTGR